MKKPNNNFSMNEIRLEYRRPPIESMKQVSSSEELEEVMREEFDDMQIDLKEFFWIILMTNSNHILGIKQISIGSSSGTVVDGKEIFQYVLKYNAVSFALCHNHPSGNLSPSKSDLMLTKKLKKFAEMIDVKLLDHIIITSESYYSFADEDVL